MSIEKRCRGHTNTANKWPVPSWPFPFGRQDNRLMNDQQSPPGIRSSLPEFELLKHLRYHRQNKSRIALSAAGKFSCQGRDVCRFIAGTLSIRTKFRAKLRSP